MLTCEGKLLIELAAEAGNPLQWWYLSFADDHGFRGGAHVEARGSLSAVKRTHDLGINPGGQVLIFKIPEKLCPPPAEVQNRLLSLEELRPYLGPMVHANGSKA